MSNKLVTSHPQRLEEMCPLAVGHEKGPQIFEWTSSKVDYEMWALCGKGKHFCFANGHTMEVTVGIA